MQPSMGRGQRACELEIEAPWPCRARAAVSHAREKKPLTSSADDVSLAAAHTRAPVRARSLAGRSTSSSPIHRCVVVCSII